MLTAFLGLLLACGIRPGPHVQSACPDVPFIPQGQAVKSGCDCPDGVAFLCGSREICAIEQSSVTCEDRDEVAEFLNGDCAGCNRMTVPGGILSAQCGD